jgi:hypothetical protein
VKFREHRGSLADAMETVIEVADRPALIEHIKALEPWGWSDCYLSVVDGDVTIEPYGYDNRIGWDTHIVKLKGYGVIGFTNGPL